MIVTVRETQSATKEKLRRQYEVFGFRDKEQS